MRVTAHALSGCGAAMPSRARASSHTRVMISASRGVTARSVAARARRGRARGRRDAGGDSVDDDGAVEDALAARARASARDGDAADIARDVARRTRGAE